MEVKVVPSRRRKKRVEAHLEAGMLVVQVPAGISETQLAPIIDKLKARA